MPRDNVHTTITISYALPILLSWFSLLYIHNYSSCNKQSGGHVHRRSVRLDHDGLEAVIPNTTPFARKPLYFIYSPLCITAGCITAGVGLGRQNPTPPHSSHGTEEKRTARNCSDWGLHFTLCFSFFCPWHSCPQGSARFAVG
ncbi:hypothetical protein QBC46DRAFT_25448 [Diplogelasinospora grovesii]|uniref:Uncharacterized protein n=1 Tax=Diplogelasinospora grovesii TaxID=303347 RepID=A0AAN6MZX6_9PEZI|nr:hypothetical protein QBC46DRAFT_25448 [Diplogelasinospora grovesii]